MRRLAIVLVLFIGCKGGGESPTDPSSVPNIRGNYTSANFLTIRVTESNGQTGTITCPGHINISNQVGANFAGSSVWGPGNCSPPTTFDVRGVVRSGGGLEITSMARAGGSGNWADATGCRVVTADPTINGVVSNGRFTAGARATIDCQTEGRLTLSFQMDGIRQ